MKKALIFILLIFILAGCSNKIQEQSDTSTASSIQTPAKQEPTTSALKPAIQPSEAEEYQQAMAFIKEKHYPQAMGILRRLDDYKDSKSLLQQLRYLINGSYICNGIWFAAAITSDGSVQMSYSGDNSNYSKLEAWKDVKSICSGGASIEGLTKEGTILTTSTETKEDFLNSSNIRTYAMANVVESVSIWKDIISFDEFYPQTAIGLTGDGSVYAAYPGYEDGTVRLNGWNDLVDVKDGQAYAVGIKSDGTVISKSFNYIGKIDTSNWTNIVAISADKAIIGLKEDGTVISTGLSVGKVSDWKDIIAISTSRYCTLGLKSDGTVVAAGQNNYGQMNVQEWKDIVAIAVEEYFSIGLKSDGTMVIAGDCNESGVKTPDVTGMKDLYVPQIDLKN
ncbi:MAG: RCC1 domain-containing protein [Mobilitalea sp.]